MSDSNSGASAPEESGPRDTQLRGLKFIRKLFNTGTFVHVETFENFATLKH